MNMSWCNFDIIASTQSEFFSNYFMTSLYIICELTFELKLYIYLIYILKKKIIYHDEFFFNLNKKMSVIQIA